MNRLIAVILCVALMVCTVLPSVSAESTSFVYSDLSDPKLLHHVEDALYTELVYALNSEDYLVENVQVVFISKEYLDEVEYNSRANIYFGYTLSELEDCFEGEKYVFSLGEDGTTIVKPFEAYDDTYDRALRNLAVGGGIILICVTVSLVSAPALPAVGMIFAASAKSGAILAVSGGSLGAVAAGAITYMETGDMDAAFKDAALVGSEEFLWGAVAGTLSGGAKQTHALKGATLGGLTMNEAAAIQKESKLPLDFIKSFHSLDEYLVYKSANLKLRNVRGKWILAPDIDWDLIDINGDTNRIRILAGKNPIALDGKSFEVHHIGQKDDAPFAILTWTQHHNNSKALHPITKNSEVDHGAHFLQEKKQLWKDLYEADTGLPLGW